jgi:hypothetical protein
MFGDDRLIRFREEADLLGDKIGIMAFGRLNCIGTGLRLKNKYGLGYRLNIAASPGKKDQVAATLKENGFKILASSGDTFVLGLQNDQLEKALPFFRNMEKMSGTEGFEIEQWGLSQTSIPFCFC